MGLRDRLFGPRLRLPDPERTCEAAWLPLWQAQLVLHELWEREVPAAMSEDFTSHLGCGAREPMARIYVLERRRARADEIICAVIGHPPARSGG